jgi:hypothetical protein
MYQRPSVHLGSSCCRHYVGRQHTVSDFHADDSTRDLNPNIAADGLGTFRFKWPVLLNTSNKKYTLKDVSIYLLPKFVFLLEIDGGGNPNTLFSK